MTIKRALIVDDSKVARFALRKLLEKMDLDVTMAGSGEEAIEAVEQGEAPDVIFMDHLMPGMNGIDASKQIRTIPAAEQIPIVMCTSKRSDDFAEEIGEVGIHDVLTKPADPAQVDELLSKLGQSASADNALSDDDISSDVLDLGDLGGLDGTDNLQAPAEAPAAGITAEDLPTDLIQDVARSAVRSSINNRIHDLLASLFEEQNERFRQAVTTSTQEQKALLEKIMQEQEQSIKDKTDAIKGEIAAEVSMFISNQLKELKADLVKQIDTQTALTPDFEDLKEQLGGGQSIDTEFWQQMQAEAIQQAHEMSRSTAEDIAEQSIETFIRRQQRENAKFYGYALAVSIGVFATGIALISGIF